MIRAWSPELPAASRPCACYKGIPFAAPPLGENRWKAPQPVAKWDGVRKADAFGAPCAAGPAGGGRGGGRGAAPGAAAPAATAPVAPPREPARSEDCLYLNVWTSANNPNDRRPVMVWIYGGGFTGGSGGLAWYDGENLAAKGPVIVTLNYRLGSLGFFAHPELAKESGHNAAGNYGMMAASTRSPQGPTRRTGERADRPPCHRRGGGRGPRPPGRALRGHLAPQPRRRRARLDARHGPRAARRRAGRGAGPRRRRPSCPTTSRSCSPTARRSCRRPARRRRRAGAGGGRLRHESAACGRSRCTSAPAR